MNKTKIEWTDYSWNPVTGCLHGCWYCYAKKLFTRFHKSFDPIFYPDRLGEPAKLKKPSKIFVCSVSDLFAPWTKKKWRDAVLKAIEECPVKHTFQLLTKQPTLIDKDYQFPGNVWVGVTVSNQAEAGKIEEIRKVKAKVKFVSFEPLLGEIDMSLEGIDWVIVGKLTGSRKIKLNPLWVKRIKTTARLWGIPIFFKDNLKWPEKLQEFPEGA